MKADLQATGRHFPREIIQCLDSSSEDYVPESLISKGLLIFSAGFKQAHQVCEPALSPPSPSNLALLRVQLSDFVRLLSQMMPKLDPFSAVLSYKHFLGLLPTSIPFCSLFPCSHQPAAHVSPVRTASPQIPQFLLPQLLQTMPPLPAVLGCSQSLHTSSSSLPCCSSLSPSVFRYCPQCSTALTMCPVLSCKMFTLFSFKTLLEESLLLQNLTHTCSESSLI